jgi:membrane-associated phospholipid phosphatase
MKKCILSFTLLLSFVFANSQSVDLKLLNKINGPVNAQTDKTWNTISDLNAPVCIITPVTIFLVGQFRKDKVFVNKSYEVASSVLIAEVFTFSLKNIISRDRPYVTYPNEIFQKTEADGHSFPSGHTSTAFALATSMTLNFPEWYIIVPFYAYASAIAYSRMYLGVHYPSDVLGGIIVGAGSAYLSNKVNAWLQKKSK